MGGGGSTVETRYDYVDYTERIVEATRREEERYLAEKRRWKELEEQHRIEKEKEAFIEFERQCFLAEQEEIKLAEEMSIVDESERLERERQIERQLEAKASSERSALFSYKLGSKTESKYVRSLSLCKLRIGVFGPTGSGKSCFINTCERAVLHTDKGSVPIANSGAEGTIILEDYLPQTFFRLVDTRGFFSYDHHEGKEMNDIMYGRIKSGDPIERSKTKSCSVEEGSKEVPLEKWLHGIILVVKANDVRLRNGSLEMYLSPMRDIIHAVGLSPVTVVTHRDTLHTQEDCEKALELASAATGSSRSHTFFVANYCPDNPGPNVRTELEIFNILHFAILTAERYVKIAKQQRKNKEMDEIEKALENATIGAPSDLHIVSNASIEIFLDVLQRKYKWKEMTVKNVLRQLQEEDISTLKALVETWDQISQIFPLGMKNMVQRHLKGMDML